MDSLMDQLLDQVLDPFIWILLGVGILSIGGLVMAGAAQILAIVSDSRSDSNQTSRPSGWRGDSE